MLGWLWVSTSCGSLGDAAVTDMSTCSLPWARSGHISVTGKAATYLRSQPLVDEIFSAEYPCPPPCCSSSLWDYSSKKQIPCTETGSWEPFFLCRPRGDNPFFLSSQQVLWLSLQSLHCHNPSSCTTQGAAFLILPCLAKPVSITSLGSSGFGGQDVPSPPHFTHTQVPER